MRTITIAMTTAPREQTTLELALASLRRAGFDTPVHLFAEPNSALDGVEGDGVILHQNSTTAGCFGNWKRALRHLLESTAAPWLLIVQDDAVWNRGASAILTRQMKLSTTGAMSAYVTAINVPKKLTVGQWHACRAGWHFCGALAFCLRREVAEDLLTCRRFSTHATNEQVDAVVAASLDDMGRRLFVPAPSLVDHIGVKSTLGHLNTDHRGYRFGDPWPVRRSGRRGDVLRRR